ncbi:potassium channel family protein [Tropicimonas sp. IMCC34043]|uniref:potassium channel family protein n=1 Tax=Tropicimonas sp. IMCC34043 TaxID=2248760 RepID=UPI001E2E560D|nr:potassium channel family protein [Tropicimonas sp. IMCC34043]
MSGPAKKRRRGAIHNGRDVMAGFFEAILDPGVRILMGLTATVVMIAAVVYSRLEGWSAVDSLYFSAVTIATVGYGDLVPTTAAAKLFTVLYLVVGIGLFVALASAVAGHLIHRARMDLGLEPDGKQDPNEGADPAAEGEDPAARR